MTLGPLLILNSTALTSLVQVRVVQRNPVNLKLTRTISPLRTVEAWSQVDSLRLMALLVRLVARVVAYMVLLAAVEMPLTQARLATHLSSSPTIARGTIHVTCCPQ